MLASKNRFALLGLAAISFFTISTSGQAVTNQKCTQAVIADLYASITTPAGPYVYKAFNDVPYAYINAQGSNDKSVQINQYRQLIANIPSLLLSPALAKSTRAHYESQIGSLEKQEKSDAVTACIGAVKPQRLAAMNVPAPHKFVHLDFIREGESSIDGKKLGDCNGVPSGILKCTKASQLK